MVCTKQWIVSVLVCVCVCVFWNNKKNNFNLAPLKLLFFPNLLCQSLSLRPIFLSHRDPNNRAESANTNNE